MILQFALPYWDWTTYTELEARNDDEGPNIFDRNLFGEDDPTCFHTEGGTPIIIIIIIQPSTT